MSDLLDDLVYQTSLNNAFNANQAEINRSWQEYMSGTSHQREVKDLIAAGLNPVLSANSGSSWQGVANASADAGAANLAATYLNNQASITMSKIAADAQVAAASSAASIAAGATIRAAEINQETAYGSAPVTISGNIMGNGGSITLPSNKIDQFNDYLHNQPNSASAYEPNRSGSFRIG